jgi:predicted dinucleotide-binding enzyme
LLVSTLKELHGLEGKVVITPVKTPPEDRVLLLCSTAGRVLSDAGKKAPPPDAKVCTAFNNIAANRWQALDEPLEYSVAVCGDDVGAKEMVMALAASIPHLEPLLMRDPLQRHQWSRA